MTDTDRLAALLCEVFPAANRNQWPFAAMDVAASLIAAGVTLARPDTAALKAWCTCGRGVLPENWANHLKRQGTHAALHLRADTDDAHRCYCTGGTTGCGCTCHEWRSLQKPPSSQGE